MTRYPEEYIPHGIKTMIQDGYMVYFSESEHEYPFPGGTKVIGKTIIADNGNIHERITAQVVPPYDWNDCMRELLKAYDDFLRKRR